MPQPQMDIGLIATRISTTITHLCCIVLVLGAGGYLIGSHLNLVSPLVVPSTIGERTVNLGQLILGFPILIGLIGLTLSPSARRILQHETARRSFQINMEDVLHAYHAAHLADRGGAFNLSNEYDAVKERMQWLLHHPDLGTLDGEVLELAAQMSAASRTIAEQYSDTRVEHALASLAARQREMRELQRNIENAQRAEASIRSYLQHVEMDDALAHSQLVRHTEAITELLAEAGMEWRHDGTVVPLRRTPLIGS